MFVFPFVLQEQGIRREQVKLLSQRLKKVNLVRLQCHKQIGELESKLGASGESRQP